MSWLRRRWRGIVAAFACLALVAGTGAWYLARFPATPEKLAGTPFTVLVQDGVPTGERDGIRAGLRASHEYVRAELGVPDDVPAEVRVSWSNGCTWYATPQSVATAWADGADFLCLNAAHQEWRRNVPLYGYYPAYVAAHEHTHNVQAQLGCARDRDDQEWLWLFEGMADEIAYSALARSGLATSADARQRIKDIGGLDPRLGSLGDYERPSSRAGNAYGLFHLAAHLLTERAGPRSLAEFCRATGHGTPWHEAFARAFGVRVDEFYVLVDTERART